MRQEFTVDLTGVRTPALPSMKGDSNIFPGLVKKMPERLPLLFFSLALLAWIVESVMYVQLYFRNSPGFSLSTSLVVQAVVRIAILVVILSFWAYMRMVTRRIWAAEKSARIADGELRQVFDNTATGLCLIDTEGRITRMNKTLAGLLGDTPANLTGKRCSEVFSFPICNDKRCVLKRIIKGQSRIVEYDINKKLPGGVHNHCVLTAVPYKGLDGEILGVVVDFKDITERKLLEEKLTATRDELQSLAAHLQFVREEERKEVARELHDELGSRLTILKMGVVDISNRLLPFKKDRNLAPLLDKTGSLEYSIDEGVKLLRKVVSRLRPGILDDLGLVPAIEWLVEEFRANSGMQCRFDSEVEQWQPGSDEATAIFRVLQELLTNVLRHSGATEVDVMIRKTSWYTSLIVRDNGRGINDGEIAASQSFGLMGIKERAEIFKWIFTISALPTGGTEAVLRVHTQEIRNE